MDIAAKTAAHLPTMVAPAAKDGQAREVSREFEAMFLAQAVEEMLKNVDIGSFGGGHSEEIWRSFLARAYAEELAGQGTTGIAQSVETTIAAYRKGMAEPGGQGG